MKKYVLSLLALTVASGAFAQGTVLGKTLNYETQKTDATEQPYQAYPSTQVGEKSGVAGKFVYETSLMRAVSGKDVDSVKTLLRARVDPNEKNEEGFTPLYKAAENGSLNIVQVLIEGEAKVDEANSYGITPLMAAAANGHSNIVAYLLNNGADVHKIDVLAKSALHHAAAGGDVKTTDELLRYGARLEMPDRYGETPLIIALKTKNDLVAADFIKKDANLEAADLNGVSAQNLVLAYSPKTEARKTYNNKVKAQAQAAKNKAKNKAADTAANTKAAVRGAVPVAHTNTASLNYEDNVATQNKPMAHSSLVVEKVETPKTKTKKKK
ncbi:hypothetical protein AAIR98_001594 [Elusimicrobium simillimum]|uniref:ankyrin repeat domain-containing protein n=1 Tax=Elusimicrobium simillimum TaxID=3143438 RepID=UPI003C7024D3